MHAGSCCTKAAGRPPHRGDGVLPDDMMHMLPELIMALGGDPVALGAEAGVALPPVGTAAAAGLSKLSAYQAARLLDVARYRLDCPDLGLRLAELQRGDHRRNLFELVMRHSVTLRAAFAWVAHACRTYSGSVGVALLPAARGQHSFVRIEADGTGTGGDRQLVELMVLRMRDVARDLCGGRACGGDVWFAHNAGAPPSVYRRHFATPVRFGQVASGFFLDTADLDTPIAGADPQILELAIHFIGCRFPEPERRISVRARSAVSHMLEHAMPCTVELVADRLGIHHRTLQRRLREEGTSFETIRDDVRRDLAWRGIAQDKIPFSQLAEQLGYAEVSALSRSCRRWFDRSPRRLRDELA